MQKLTQRIAADRAALADNDQSDYVGLGLRMEAIVALEGELGVLEERWLELTELLE